jgi:hypothetical protein
MGCVFEIWFTKITLKFLRKKKMKTRIYLILTIMFVCSLYVKATDITFTSSGTITDGNTYAVVYVQNNGTAVSMSGGQISDYLGVIYGGTFNMSGGLISGQSVHIGSSSTFNITAGTMDIFELAVMDSGICNITGGNIAIDVLKTFSTSIVNISGYDFNYNPTTKVLTGYLQDNNLFTIAGVDALEYAGLNLIPEPISVLLFGFGLLALRRTKK